MTNMNQTEIIGLQNSNPIVTNNSANFEERIKSIQKILSENGAEVSFEEIEIKLKELADVYKVPIAEAQRSTIHSFLKKYNISKAKVFTGKGFAETKKIADILLMSHQPDSWVNLKGRVVQLWENAHESIAQVGLLSDETGVVKFTLWSNAGMEPMELNQTYDFKNVVVKTWNGKVNIDVNKAASIVLSEEKIENVRFEGGLELKDKKNEERTVSQLNQDGIWTDLKATVIQLFENTHESIAFAGVLGDETGTMRFTIWKTSGIEDIQIEKTYKISNAIVKEWNGNFSLEINRAGKIEESEEKIVAKPTVFEVSGCAVDIQAGSGLIKRCPECNKVMSKGLCAEHGKQKGKYDLRIKAVLDDGNKAYETIINCELTQNLLHLSLEEAVLMATETLDPDCITDLIKNGFIGKYYTVKGIKTDRYIIAECVKRTEFANQIKIKELKEKVETDLQRIEDEFNFKEFEKMIETVAELKSDFNPRAENKIKNKAELKNEAEFEVETGFETEFEAKPEFEFKTELKNETEFETKPETKENPETEAKRYQKLLTDDSELI